MLGLEHDPELAPIDGTALDRLEKAPRAVGEVGALMADRR